MVAEDRTVHPVRRNMREDLVRSRFQLLEVRDPVVVAASVAKSARISCHLKWEPQGCY